VICCNCRGLLLAAGAAVAPQPGGRVGSACTVVSAAPATTSSIAKSILTTQHLLIKAEGVQLQQHIRVRILLHLIIQCLPVHPPRQAVQTLLILDQAVIGSL